MKTRRLLLVLLLAGARCCAFPLGDAAEIAVPAGWAQGSSTEAGAPAAAFPTIEFHPTDGRNEKVFLTLVPKAVVHFSDRVSLKASLMRGCAALFPTPGFVPAIKNIEVPGSIGAYASLVDPSLVGKPPQKNNFKVATPVFVLLPSGNVVQATLLTDTVSGADFDEAMSFVKNLTPLEPKAQAEAPSEISIPGLDATLRIPAGRFARKADGLNASPNYFSFTDGTGVILSGWLDHASAFPGMTPFWAKEKAAQLKGGFAIKSEMVTKIGDWDAILYVVPVGPNIQQKNVRACRVLGGTWADIHLSKTAQGSTFRELEDAVRSLELVAAGEGRTLTGK
ncbi:MAG TPA: hypothetical protein VIJ19_11615 [Opitutaceae bacterium]